MWGSGCLPALNPPSLLRASPAETPFPLLHGAGGIKKLLLLPSDLSFHSLVFIAPLFLSASVWLCRTQPCGRGGAGAHRPGLAPGSLEVIAGQCPLSPAQAWLQERLATFPPNRKQCAGGYTLDVNLETFYLVSLFILFKRIRPIRLIVTELQGVVSKAGLN